MFLLEEPPLEYWKVLAEKRRVALLDTLRENEQVLKLIHVYAYILCYILIAS